jgi:hypothetical protein
MKKKFTLILLSTALLLSSCAQTYEDDFLASGITVTITNGGFAVTHASGVLDKDRRIKNVKIDSLLIPFYGMAVTTRVTGVEQPAGITILDNATRDSTNRYQFIPEDATINPVISKKDLGALYTMNTAEERDWASQVTRLEDYLVGKDISDFLNKVCVTEVNKNTCINRLNNKDEVKRGSIIDFYGYDGINGVTISVAENNYDNIGLSLVEMFRAKEVKVAKVSSFNPILSYKVELLNNVLKVTFTNKINATTEIIDFVEIPLRIALNSIQYNDTRTFITFDNTSPLIKPVEAGKLDVDYVYSSYEIKK